MSIIFNPTVIKCFAPCADSLAGKWCQCQQGVEITVEQTPKERFEDVAEAFMKQMLKENKDNIVKGNILEWDNVDEMLIDLEYHKAKLYFALKSKNPEGVKEYLADCANILLAIGNSWELY